MASTVCDHDLHDLLPGASQQPVCGSWGRSTAAMQVKAKAARLPCSTSLGLLRTMNMICPPSARRPSRTRRKPTWQLLLRIRSTPPPSRSQPPPSPRYDWKRRRRSSLLAFSALADTKSNMHECTCDSAARSSGCCSRTGADHRASRRLVACVPGPFSTYGCFQICVEFTELL